ncbi:MAG: SGNH/GDSL hydrolase family protein [Clostridia bacterium]|nr:SGNH/GDSL hydrolase family protein [Clostridia bacterium]
MENHWKGKLWYAYGTSMTSVEQGKFVPVVEKLSGLRVVNKGIPGGALTPNGYGKGNMKRAVMTLEDGKADADLITLEVLPNEGAKVGGIYDTDDESFCGCFNQAIRYLQENTNAQIVVIIMIGGNTSAPEAIIGKRQMTNFEFASTIERVARLNGVPVINVFMESGLGYARVKNRNYQLDQIHLNDLGGKIMGKFIWSKLKDIPTWDTSL